MTCTSATLLSGKTPICSQGMVKQHGACMLGFASKLLIDILKLHISIGGRCKLILQLSGVLKNPYLLALNSLWHITICNLLC